MTIHIHVYTINLLTRIFDIFHHCQTSFHHHQAFISSLVRRKPGGGHQLTDCLVNGWWLMMVGNWLCLFVNGWIPCSAASLLAIPRPWTMDSCNGTFKGANPSPWKLTSEWLTAITQLNRWLFVMINRCSPVVQLDNSEQCLTLTMANHYYPLLRISNHC